MEFKTTNNVATGDSTKTGVRVEDISRSAKDMARRFSNIGSSSVQILERELSAAITISERIRDDVVTPVALERSRKREVVNQLRDDAHRIVDLAIDATGVVVNMGLDLINQFINSGTTKK